MLASKVKILAANKIVTGILAAVLMFWFTPILLYISLYYIDSRPIFVGFLSRPVLKFFFVSVINASYMSCRFFSCFSILIANPRTSVILIFRFYNPVNQPVCSRFVDFPSYHPRFFVFISYQSWLHVAPDFVRNTVGNMITVVTARHSSTVPKVGIFRIFCLFPAKWLTACAVGFLLQNLFRTDYIIVLVQRL